MTVTIYHNPNCGTSRNVLAMIRQSGEEPVVVEYLKNPPSRERLKELIRAMGVPLRSHSVLPHDASYCWPRNRRVIHTEAALNYRTGLPSSRRHRASAASGSDCVDASRATPLRKTAT
jgi:hypothetical protein